MDHPDIERIMRLGYPSREYLEWEARHEELREVRKMEKTSVNPGDFKLIHEKECWDFKNLKEVIDHLYDLGLQFSVTPYIYHNDYTGYNSTRYRVLIYAYNE